MLAQKKFSIIQFLSFFFGSSSSYTTFLTYHCRHKCTNPHMGKRNGLGWVTRTLTYQKVTTPSHGDPPIGTILNFPGTLPQNLIFKKLQAILEKFCRLWWHKKVCHECILSFIDCFFGGWDLFCIKNPPFLVSPIP